jgi:hypothetical protein
MIEWLILALFVIAHFALGWYLYLGCLGVFYFKKGGKEMDQP